MNKMSFFVQPSPGQLPAQQAALVEVSEKPVRAFAVPPGMRGRRLQISLKNPHLAILQSLCWIFQGIQYAYIKW